MEGRHGEGFLSEQSRCGEGQVSLALQCKKRFWRVLPIRLFERTPRRRRFALCIHRESLNLDFPVFVRR